MWSDDMIVRVTSYNEHKVGFPNAHLVLQPGRWVKELISVMYI